MIEIVKNKKYRIKGKSEYFKKKYGTSNPIITIEDNWKEITGGSWAEAQGNPACMLYGMRTGLEGNKDIPLIDDENVFYGKIGQLGELVHISELESAEKE